MPFSDSLKAALKPGSAVLSHMRGHPSTCHVEVAIKVLKSAKPLELANHGIARLPGPGDDWREEMAIFLCFQNWNFIWEVPSNNSFIYLVVSTHLKKKVK